MNLGLTDRISGYSNDIGTSDRIGKKSIETDFQGEIERKQQVFPDGDMVIPQPPRQGSFPYDNAIANKSKEAMTLDEYKQWVANEMSQMPVSGWYQSTCVGGFLTITEECFERMRTDPEWEKTVLGMVRSMYSTNGIMGSKMIGFQVIGASEAECYGEGIPVDSNAGTGSADDGESWWEKRHQEMEDLLKEQEAKAKERVAAKRKAQQEQIKPTACKPTYRNAIMVNGLAINVDPTGEIANKAFWAEKSRQINESISKVQNYYAEAYNFRSDMTEAERKMAFEQELAMHAGRGFTNLSDSYAWAASGGVPDREKQLEDAVQSALDKRRKEMLKEVGSESTYEEYLKKTMDDYMSRYTKIQPSDQMGEMNLQV